jgi:hypothetical protein
MRWFRAARAEPVMGNGSDLAVLSKLHSMACVGGKQMLSALFSDGHAEFAR